MEYANVIVDISHEKLDKIFQYRIPEHMKSTLQTGMQVTFPFGNGNRPMKGYVVGFAETPDYPPERVKELTGVAEGGVRAESQLKILFLRLPQVFSSGGTVIGMSFLCLHGVIKIHISLTKGSFIDHSCPCGPLPLWTGLFLWLPHRIKCMGMIFQQLISFINLLRTPDMLRLF